MIKLDGYLSRRAANHTALTPVDFLKRSIEVYPDKIAVIFEGQRLTYREFGVLTGRIARALLDADIRPGDVVSVLSTNRPEMLAMHFAVPMIGAVLNTINTRLDADTIGYILDHAESRLLFVDDKRHDIASAAVARANESVGMVVFGDSAGAENALALDDFLAGKEPLPISQDAIADEWTPICLNYTSGTTGRPKGVVYHHRGAYLNAIANVVTLGFNQDTSYLWILPMFHCNGWCHIWAVTAMAGTHVCLPEVDIAEIFRLISTEDISHFCCAPVVLYSLLNAPDEIKAPAKRNIRVGTGGAAPTATLIAGMARLGIELVHLYGLTESYGPATNSAPREEWGSPSPDELAGLLARQGVRHPLCAIAEVYDETGKAVPWDGETMGEIVLAGNTVMAGYYKEEEATEKAFEDNVFHTGDLAIRHPDGYIEIRDRAKDIIISGGENISSLEVESALHAHPSVMLAAVVAMPDPKWGEIPCAFVELKPGAEQPSPEELTEFCRGRLARFKVPRQFLFGELPKTATGKIQKFVLRQQVNETAVNTGTNG
jgi:fatty-acyl-CoA synthase